MSRRSFWFMVTGVALNTVALSGWALGGPLPSSDPAQAPVLVVAGFLQAAAVGFLIAATVAGIVQLARRRRPVVWPLLAALSLPLAALLWFPMVFVVFLRVG